MRHYFYYYYTIEILNTYKKNGTCSLRNFLITDILLLKAIHYAQLIKLKILR